MTTCAKTIRMALMGMSCLAPAFAGAQSFEGVITAKAGAKGATQTLQAKGSLTRVDLNFGGGPGGGPGAIIRDGQGSVIMLVPARKMYTRPPYLQGKPSDIKDFTFTRTGKKETVAGYECEWGTVKGDDVVSGATQWCVTSALGFIGFTPGQTAANVAALRKQFPKGAVVLKSLDAKGAVQYEVVKVEKKSLDASIFAPPPDYKEMKIPGGPPPA